MAGGAGDDGICEPGQPFERRGAQELDPGSMRFHRIAGKDARDFAALGQGYVEHEIVTRHAGNFQQLGMQRIVGNRTLGRHAVRA